MSKSLLIVSNDPAVREMLSRTVAEAGYRPTLAGSCAEAVKILANAPFERVLCEVFLPDGSGVELKRRLRRLAPDARVIVASSFSVIRSSDDVLRFGSSDFILDQQELVDLVQAADGPREPAAPAPGGDERIKRVFIETIDVLVGLLELNDPFFGGNSHITMEYARAVAQAMDLPPDVVDEIVVASLLHDIGRVSIRNELLSEKPEISESEFNSIKSHCENGAKLLEAIDFPWKIRPIIVHHHERFDGKGYPKGLKGREIPVGSRILAVVDAFAAMTANRPYRRSLAREEAIRELHRNVGTQFDPEIVEIFGRVVEREFVFRGVGTKPRILLVDDEVDLLTLLKLKLVNEGFDVRVTDRAEEALQQIAEERPDLVVSDVSMPGMDGIAMYRKMREMGDAGDTPLLFLSGKSDTAIKVEALNLGAEDFLGKPVDLKELAARIRNIIRRDGKRRGGGAVAAANPGIVGDLRNLGVSEIVQTLHLGVKTACVTVCGGMAGEGKLWFVDGRLRHCESEGKTGEEAFYALLRRQEGPFHIAHGQTTDTRTIRMDEMQLILEGLRRMDEETKRAETPP